MGRVLDEHNYTCCAWIQSHHRWPWRRHHRRKWCARPSLLHLSLHRRLDPRLHVQLRMNLQARLRPFNLKVHRHKRSSQPLWRL